eukprot:532959-Pyramimonas_sp.AAC.1
MYYPISWPTQVKGPGASRGSLADSMNLSAPGPQLSTGMAQFLPVHHSVVAHSRSSLPGCPKQYTPH